MKDNETLSDKRKEIKSSIKLALFGANCPKNYAEKCTETIFKQLEHQDKDFIRKLKDDCFEDINFSYGSMCVLIDKRAGPEFV